MARILADHEIEKLLGTVILDGSANCIKPNTYNVRVGSEVRFLGTNEFFKNLQSGYLIEVKPGEFVEIISKEVFDLRKETVHKIFPGKRLHSIIVASSSLTRRGLSQVSTKMDSGYYGRLSWGAKNEGSSPIRLKYEEPLYHLNFFLLAPDEGMTEIPNKDYGEREQDTMQNFMSLRDSPPPEPRVIDKSMLITSSVDKIDSVKQLKDAGPPFSILAEEFERIKNEISKLTTQGMPQMINSLKDALSQRQTSIAAITIGAIGLIISIGKYLNEIPNLQHCILAASALLFLFGISILIFYRKKIG